MNLSHLVLASALTVSLVSLDPGAASARESRSCRGVSYVAVGFSPDGKHLATAGMSLPIKVWDSFTGKEVRRVTESSTWASRALYLADGNMLVVGDEKGKLRIISPTGDAPGEVLGEGNAFAVPWATLSRDGKLLASQAGEGEVAVRSLASPNQVRKFTAPQMIWSCDFSPDGKVLAVSSYDRRVHIWNLETGKETFQIDTREQCYSVAFSPDGKTLACGADVGIITFWNASNGAYQYTVGHSGAVMGLAYSRDGKKLASVSFDETTRIWDATSGQLLRRMSGGLTTVAFSPDGKRLAAGGDSTKNSVWVWDADSGKELLKIDIH